MTSLHSNSNNATGPIVGLDFLHRMTQAWKDRHIAVFMCSAPVWTGSVVSVWHGQNPADPPFPPLPSPLLHHPERRGCRAPVVSRKGSFVFALPCLFMLDAFLCMYADARSPSTLLLDRCTSTCTGLQSLGWIASPHLGMRQLFTHTHADTHTPP